MPGSVASGTPCTSKVKQSFYCISAQRREGKRTVHLNVSSQFACKFWMWVSGQFLAAADCVVYKLRGIATAGLSKWSLLPGCWLAILIICIDLVSIQLGKYFF